MSYQDRRAIVWFKSHHFPDEFCIGSLTGDKIANPDARLRFYTPEQHSRIKLSPKFCHGDDNEVFTSFELIMTPCAKDGKKLITEIRLYKNGDADAPTMPARLTSEEETEGFNWSHCLEWSSSTCVGVNIGTSLKLKLSDHAKKIWGELGRLRHGGSFRAWISTVASNDEFFTQFVESVRSAPIPWIEYRSSENPTHWVEFESPLPDLKITKTKSGKEEIQRLVAIDRFFDLQEYEVYLTVGVKRDDAYQQKLLQALEQSTHKIELRSLSGLSQGYIFALLTLNKSAQSSLPGAGSTFQIHWVKEGRTSEDEMETPWRGTVIQRPPWAPEDKYDCVMVTRMPNDGGYPPTRNGGPATLSAVFGRASSHRKAKAIHRLCYNDVLKSPFLNRLRSVLLGHETVDLEPVYLFDGPEDEWLKLPGVDMVTNRLNEYQMDGLKHSLKPPGGIGIITGPPGTGKTYLIIALTKVLVMLGHKVLLCAPSNEATDHLAISIHNSFPELKVCRAYRPTAEEHQHKNWRSSEVEEDNLISKSAEVVNTIAQLKGDRRNRMAHKELSLIMHCITLAMDIEEGRRPRPTVKISETESGPLKLDAFMEVCGAYEAGGTVPRKTLKKSGKQLRQLAACILGSASVVVTTCNSADSMDLRQFYRQTVVIYDEAAQTDEPDTLIALTRESVKAVILVGDTNQLRPIVVSTGQNEFAHQLERSMQARLLSINYPSVLLKIQYRMLPSISLWPNQTFYNGQLTDGPGTTFDSRPLASVFSRFLLNGYGIRSRSNRVLVTPTLRGLATRSPSGSLSNNDNLNLTVSMVKRLTTLHSFDPAKISIIVFYEQQRLNYAHVLEALQLLEPTLRTKLQGITVATVDSFQGKENEITFLDLVNDGGEAGGEVGFVKDEKRLNVACTRAKCGLVIVGNPNMCNSLNAARQRRPQLRHRYLQSLFDDLRRERSIYALGADDEFSSIIEKGSFGGKLVPEVASFCPVFPDELLPKEPAKEDELPPEESAQEDGHPPDQEMTDKHPPEESAQEDEHPPDQEMTDVEDALMQSGTPLSLDLDPPTPVPRTPHEPSDLW